MVLWVTIVTTAYPARAQQPAQPRLGAPPAASSLTAAPVLAKVYDTILDARFDRVPAMLAAACPPAPAQACELLQLASLWWQIQLDPDSRAHDARFESDADAAIADTERWTTQEPQRAEAWFYLGAAYGARAQWRVLRGERLGAARDGKRIKDALERALALDPVLQDAWFGIGLYHYYAAVAPALAKMLRFLLALPGGDRAGGLAEMQRARRAGQLLRDEADYQLQVIYLWYEHEPQRALELLEGLARRHASNPLFVQLIAEVQQQYLRNPVGSLRTWTALLDSARARRVAEPQLAAVRAQLGIARSLDELYETDAALPHVRAVIAERPSAPYGALAQAQLQLGQALDRLGLRAEATTAYRAAASAAPDPDPHRIGDQARTGLRTVPDARAALAYRVSLDGWRAFERGALDEAAGLLTRALSIDASNAVIRFRRARVLDAQGRHAEALDAFERLIADWKDVPPLFLARASLESGRLFEAEGDRAHALERYRAIGAIEDADEQTRQDAVLAIDRLTR